MSANQDLISQVHSGVGHNVGGDQHLHLYSNLAPADIRGQVDIVLEKIREKEHEKAELVLDVLRSGDTLNSEARAVLDMLSINLGLSSGKKLDGAHRVLITHLGNLKNDIARDLCFAILVRFECRFDRESDAKRRCETESILGVYSREVYYELVSSKEVLYEVFSGRELDLSEGELTGLIYGALRLEEIELAKLALSRLDLDYPSENSAILKLYTRAVVLNPVLKRGQYWCLNKSINLEILAVAQECSNLISAGKGNDGRLFNIAIPILSYLLCSHESLLKVCWDHVDKINGISKEFAAELYLRMSGDYSRLKGIRLELHKAESDIAQRKLTLNRILPSLKVSSEELPLLLALSSKEQLRVWRSSGGVCISEQLLEVDSANLLIAISLCAESDPATKGVLRAEADLFYKRHAHNFSELSQFFLDTVTRKFLEFGFSDLACNYLEEVLPKEDFCLSPLFDTYINSLFYALRKKTLLGVLDSLAVDDWGPGLWCIKANLDYALGNIPQALISIKSALSSVPNNIECWRFAFQLTRDCPDLLDDPFFVKLPEELFSNLSVSGLQLLHELVRLDRFEYVESVLIEWFVANPNANAKPISDFHYSTMLTLPHVLMSKVSESSGRVVSAVEYKSGNDRLIKLVVDGEQVSNEFCINSKSSLAKELLTKSPGDVFHNGMNEIEFIERHLPYIAVLRMATAIRLRQNDGADVFYKLEAPSSPEKLLPFMEETLRRQDNQNDNSDFYADTSIPIFMKGFKRFPSDPVKAAIQQFSHNNAYKHSIISVGEENPKFISLDIYTLCYICLIGFSETLIKSFDAVYISSNTKKALDEWLLAVFDDKYLTLALDPSGRLIRTTAEDIKKSDQTLFDGMKMFSERAKILKSVAFDAPAELVMVRDFIDATVFSTMQLSLENEIPWLCIDNQIGSFFQASGGSVVNARKFFLKLGAAGTYESKKIGFFMYAQGAVPYVSTWRDFYLMAMSTDFFSDNTLAKILRLDNSVDISLRENYVNLAGVVAQSIISSVSIDGDNLYSRIHNEVEVEYSSQVVYAVLAKIIKNSDKGPEDAFADFYLIVLDQLHNSKYLKDLATLVFVRFMSGHFLDSTIIVSSLKRLAGDRSKVTQV